MIQGKWNDYWNSEPCTNFKVERGFLISLFKYYLSLLLILLQVAALGQIINTEDLRLNRNEKGLSGRIDLQARVGRNNAGQRILIGTDMGFEYLTKKSNSILLVTGYHLTQFNRDNNGEDSPTQFNNHGFAHLRYNHHFNEQTTLEIFSQIQSNRIQNIELRVLHGAGLRFTLFRSDTASFFLGMSYMYEYEEELLTASFLNINRDHRLSSYISGHVQLNSLLSFAHVSYLQPKLFDLDDLRISSATTLQIQLNNAISFQTSIHVIYDTNPPPGVVRTRYSMRNGIGILF